MSYKFKIGDRVRNLHDNGRVKKGATGTVDEDDEFPFVKWDSEEMITDSGKTMTSWIADKRISQHQDHLKLITEEQPKPNTEQVIYGPQEKKEFLPGPLVKSDGAPQPNTIEWWRWIFAAQSLQAHRGGAGDNSEKIARWAVNDANALIAELQKKGGKQ